MATIKANLPQGSGLSISQIQASLKDRLHTFREIQNAFSSQLHTFNEIEADLISRGYVKGFYATYNFLTTKPTDGTKVTGDSKILNEIVTTPTGPGKKFIVFTLPAEFDPIIDGINVDGTVKEATVTNFIKDDKRFIMLISKDSFDATKAHTAYINFKVDKTGSSSFPQIGIEVDDGTTDKSNVSKLNIEGMYVSDPQGSSNEITIKAATSWENIGGQSGGKTSTVKVEEPLEVYIDPNVSNVDETILRVKHGYYEKAKAPGYLAYLAEDELVTGKGISDVRVAHIWFDDIVVPHGSFIGSDRANKSISLQEWDQKDPNITGGDDYLIAYRIAMKGKAIQDGYVEIFLQDKATGRIVEDMNGTLMSFKRAYKTGDDLGVIESVGIKSFKGIQEIQFFVEHSFGDSPILIEDRTQGASGIMVQAINGDNKTGDALLQFENDTAQNIEFSTHYNGADLFNVAWLLGKDVPAQVGDAGKGVTSVDGLHFYNSSKASVGIQNKHLIIKDDGEPCFYSFGKIFTAEKTLMLRGKEIDVSVTLTDKDSAYNVYMATWGGDADKYTKKIVTDLVNSNLVVEPDWTLSSNKIFIPEDVVVGDHTQTGKFTVPSDANNFAIIIVPVEKQAPQTLSLKEFKADVTVPFTGYSLDAPELVNELHLIHSDKHIKFGNPVHGYASYRFTIDKAPSKLPLGIKLSGNAKIINDRSWTVGTDYGNEGDMKFEADGIALIKTNLIVHVGEKVPVNGSSDLSIWWAKKESNGSWTKIVESDLTTVVKKGAKAEDDKFIQMSLPAFRYSAKEDDVLRLFASTDIDDGAFVEVTQTTVGHYMIDTTIDFEEYDETKTTNLAKLADIEFTQAAIDNGVYIEVDYDGSKPVLTAKVK